MKKIFNKIKFKWNILSKKRKIFVLSSFAILVLILVVPNTSLAGFGDWFIENLAQSVAYIVIYISRVLIGVVNFVVGMEIKLLMMFLKFKNFTKGIPAVEQGWIVVRDICNMFFILALLVIAFATILQYEAYSYKRWFVKLVIAAVLVNFSKTITGLMIDFSQVVMLTFVNAFRDVAAGNLVEGLHLNELYNLQPTTGEQLQVGTNAAASVASKAISVVLALVILIIVAVVVLVIIVVVVSRMVTLWILTILSPIAFFLQGTPFGKQYASRWWTELGKNLVAGPVLAFFLYITFFTIKESILVEKDRFRDLAGDELTIEGTTGFEAALTTFLTGGNIFDFIIVIGLLLMSLKFAQESGAAGAKFAGKASGQLSKAGRGAVKVGKNIGKSAVRKVGRDTRHLGVKAINSNTKFGRAIKDTTFGKFATSWNKDLDKSRDKKITAKREKMFQKLGMSGDTTKIVADEAKKRRAQIEQVKKGAGGAGYGAFAGAALGGPAGMLIGAALGTAMAAKKAQMKKYEKRSPELYQRYKKAEKQRKQINKKIKEENKERVARGEKPRKLLEPIKFNKYVPNPNQRDDKIEKQRKQINKKIKKANKERVARGEKPRELLKRIDKYKLKSKEELAKTYEASHTEKAGYKMAQEKVIREQKVGAMAASQEYFKGNREWYYASGQSKTSKLLINEMRGNDKAVQSAADYVNSDPTTDPKYATLDTQARVRFVEKYNEDIINISKGLAAYQKGEGDMTGLQRLTDAISKKVGTGSIPDLKSVDNFVRDDLIIPAPKYRDTQTGTTKNENDKGKFSSGNFGRKDSDGNYMTNNLRMDFRDIQKMIPGLNVTAQGVNLTDKNQIAQVSAYATQQLDNQIKALHDERDNALASGGEFNESVFKSKEAKLIASKERLSSPDGINNLELSNSGIESGHRDVIDTINHEKIHSAGVKDEYTTEAIAKKAGEKHMHGSVDALGKAAAEYEKDNKKYVEKDSKDLVENEYNFDSLIEKIKTDNGTEQRVDNIIKSEEARFDTSGIENKLDEMSERLSTKFGEGTDKLVSKLDQTSGSSGKSSTEDRATKLYESEQRRMGAVLAQEHNKLTREQMDQDMERSQRSSQQMAEQTLKTEQLNENITALESLLQSDKDSSNFKPPSEPI